MQLLIKAADLYEPAGAEEENAFNVVITETDSQEDVLTKNCTATQISKYKMPNYLLHYNMQFTFLKPFILRNRKK